MDTSLTTIEQLRQGKVPQQGERVVPAQEDWWNVNSGLNLSTFGFADNFETGFPFALPFYLDKNVKKILEVGLTLKFQKFRGYTKPLSHTHSVTIADHTHTVTIETHQHTITIPIQGVAVGSMYDAALSVSSLGGVPDGTLNTEADHNFNVYGASADAGGSSTPTSSSGGGATVTSASGDGAEYGIFEDSYPAVVAISMDGVDITANLGGPFGPVLGADTFPNLDLTPFVNGGGLHILELTTTTRGRAIPLLWVKSIVTR